MRPHTLLILFSALLLACSGKVGPDGHAGGGGAPGTGGGAGGGVGAGGGTATGGGAAAGGGGATLPELMGHLDAIDADGDALGWALAPELGEDWVLVRFYVDGDDSGTPAGLADAWLPRPDVNQHENQPGDHGFSWRIPDAFRDGQPHAVRAYAVGPRTTMPLGPGPLDFTLAPVYPHRAGPVRLDGRSLRDDTGQFSALGSSLFSAVRWYRSDRARLERNLDFLARHGFDYIRVMGQLGWPGREVDPRWSDYADDIAGVTDLAYDKYGIRVEWTIFGGTDFTPTAADRLALVDTFLAMSKGREQKLILFEVANEYWQNGFGGAVDELRGLAKHLHDNTGVLIAVSSATSWDDEVTLYTGGVADVVTVHPDRTVNIQPDGPWRAVRQPWGEPNDALGMVASDDEPIGPGSSVSSERDPTRLVMSAVTAYVSQLPFYTFHSRAGVGADYANCAALQTCDLNGDKDLSDMPGADAFGAMKRYLPDGIETWTRQNHYWAGHPFNVYGDGQLNYMTTDGAQNGVMRAYAEVSGGGDFVVSLLRIQGTLHLEAKQAMKFCAIEPVSGALVGRYSLAAGDGVDLSGHEGLVLRGKNGGSDDGCREDYGAPPPGAGPDYDVAMASAVSEHPQVDVPDLTWANVLVTNTGRQPWNQGEVAFQCENTSGNWTYELQGTELHTTDFADWLQWPVQPGQTVGLRPTVVPQTVTPQGQYVDASWRCRLAHQGTPFGPWTPKLKLQVKQPN